MIEKDLNAPALYDSINSRLSPRSEESIDYFV